MNVRRPDPRITGIVDFIQRHLSEPLSVDALAERANLSRSRFAALFEAQIGVTPMRYLQWLRLRRARLLVERSFLSVKEIMTLVGYDDLSRFSRDFLWEHGAAPSDLRDEGIVTPLRTCSGPSEHRLIMR